MPWANGRGVSYEVARENDGHGEWRWRLAIAPINEDGPFSSLPGVHRELTLIDGDGLVLTIDGNMVACRRGEVVRFAGYSHTHAALTHGPVVDLNVMSREDAPMSMTIVGAPSEIRDCRCIVAIDECTLVVEGETITLGPRDALVDHASSARLDSGTVAVIAPTN
jgi:environmental stress-induced protein Ves